MNQAATDERVQVLVWLPLEKVAEVEDFVLFLHQRYGADPLTAAQQVELDATLLHRRQITSDTEKT